MKAGNTVETLKPVDVAEVVPPRDDPGEQPETPVLDTVTDDPLDYENTFDVSRAEFNELLDAFLRLASRIDKFNEGAPHKI